MNRPFRPLVCAVAACVSLASLPRVALAGVIGSEQAAAAAGLALPDAAGARSLLQTTLARADVAAALRKRGVDPAAAAARVNALTDADALALAEQV